MASPALIWTFPILATQVSLLLLSQDPLNESIPQSQDVGQRKKKKGNKKNKKYRNFSLLIPCINKKKFISKSTLSSI